MPDFCQQFRDRINDDQQEIDCIRRGKCQPPPTIGELEADIRQQQQFLDLCQAVNRDLTGPWFGDNGAVAYYIRQIGADVFWVGFNTNPDLSQFGRGFTHVFRGTRSPDGNTVTGEWADVPYGHNQLYGTLTIVRTDYINFTKQSETGGFGPSTWERAFGPAWPN